MENKEIELTNDTYLLALSTVDKQQKDQQKRKKNETECLRPGCGYPVPPILAEIFDVNCD